MYFRGAISTMPSWLFNNPSFEFNCENFFYIVADKSFNNQEREMILSATNDLEFLYNGLIKFQIDFIIDDDNKILITKNHCILKSNAKEAAIINADDNHKNYILGLCEYRSNNIKRLYIVRERLQTPFKFKMVVMHELGHLLELEHTSYWSIMHSHHNSFITYPTYADAIEVARVWKMDVEELKYFKL